MGRMPSEKTLLATERRMTRDLRKELSTIVASHAFYRDRCTKLEQECADWKRRFDLLLARTPEQSRSGDCKP